MYRQSKSVDSRLSSLLDRLGLCFMYLKKTGDFFLLNQVHW